MEKLNQHNPNKVIDLLTARLTFERSGVQLYDAIIAKLRAAGTEDAQRVLDSMLAHRDEEKEHEEWLEQQVRALGGDIHAQTELAELETRESSGIKSIVINGDNDMTHLFHALLAAELADNAGWDLLVALADEAGDRDAKKQFRKRLHEEEEHLLFVRRVVQRLARRQVLGQDVQLPTWP
jgi:bacterioferritin (cytochrome b1)